ncbi:MAG TPA: hypothetical protein VMV87_06375 [Burkholderiales bacterium]|nr:hypothetical protein [Burkholderiales bacterium]
MRFGLAAAAVTGAVLLAGCAGGAVGLRSTNLTLIGGVPPPSGSYHAAAIQAQASASAYIGLFLLGVYAAAAEDDHPSWRDGLDWRRPPQMAEDRAIAERDCSRPMRTPSANLRCR